MSDSALPRSPRLKVLLISGTGRSGSTLLANLLGQQSGFFEAGELRYIWERGLLADRLCGCGEPFNSCPVWKSIVGELLASPRDWSVYAAAQNDRLRARSLPRLLARSSKGDYWPTEMVDVVSELYGSIQRNTGCRVLVDSSKLPSYGTLLERCPDIDLYVVHLVRDPRAVAFSWSRIRDLPDVAGHQLMQRLSPLRSTLDWVLWNSVAEALWSRRAGRYVRLRYEDVVTEPATALRTIANLLGEAVTTDPLLASGVVDMKPTHSVAGNPGRMRSGRVELRADLAWTDKLAPRDRALVTALAYPLMAHYGYRLRAGNERP